MTTHTYHGGYTLFFKSDGSRGPAASSFSHNTDSGANETYDVNEDIYTGGAAGVGNYLGYVTISGTQYPVLDQGQYYRVIGINTNETNISNIGFTTSAMTAPCFARGTLIDGPNGDRMVEDLKTGDMITASDGHEIAVKWVGHRTLPIRFAGPHMQPVRIRAGALGGGLPHSDLTVTADHAMVIDGYVINSSALVNGDTIDFVPMDELEDSFTVYHIETEAHDVILANGAPSETFVDAAGRAAFDNHQEYLDLYGVERIIPEMDRPRISSQRLLPQVVKDRLGINAPMSLDRRPFQVA